MNEDQRVEVELPVPLREGQVLERRYRVRKLAGVGGMGWVLVAQDLRVKDAQIALKVLFPHLLSSTRAVSRFKREAMVTMHLSHPAIVQTYGVGEIPGFSVYLAMEFVESSDYKAVFSGSSFPEQVESLYRLADGLQYAHQAGVTHRDLKPENILCQSIDTAKIADFGIARVVQEEDELTKIGDVMGTPLYMSPEQFRGELIDERSDIYSFGIMLYELFSGVPPFESKSFLQLAEMHCEAPLPVAQLPGLASWCRTMLLRCCEKERSRRYQSVQELIATLKQHMPLGEIQVSAQEPAQLAFRSREEQRYLSSPFRRRLRKIVLLLIVVSVFLTFSAVSLMVQLGGENRASVYAYVLKQEQKESHFAPLLRAFFNVEVPSSDARLLFSPFGYNEVYSHVLPVVFSTKSLDVYYSGITPLQYWIQRIRNPLYFTVVRAMLEHGADPNLRSSSGKLPLEFAVDSGAQDVVQLLIAHGADPALPSSEEVSLAAYARRRGLEGFAVILGRRDKGGPLIKSP